MKIFDETHTIDVEALASRLLARKITRPRFKLEMTETQAAAVLAAAYRAEVEYRRRKFTGDAAWAANIRRLAGFLAGDSPKFGVMLCGLCGNGKTTTLYAFQSVLNWLSDAGRFEGGRKGIRIVDAKDVAGCMRDKKEFGRLKSEEMLGVEDMGREAAEVLDYGNAVSPVTDLLEYRYDRQLFTFVTTNLMPKEVRAKYGDRLADRFNEMMEVMVYENASYRK